METTDWLDVAALLHHIADTIEAEAADGLSGLHKLTSDADQSYLQMTLHRRRQRPGMSFNAVQIGRWSEFYLALKTTAL